MTSSVYSRLASKHSRLRRRAAGSSFYYYLYGLSVRSRWKLPYPQCSAAAPPDVELVEVSAIRFQEARRQAAPSDPQEWFVHCTLPDGATYLRWLGLYEFLISSDGRRISSRCPNGISRESFLVYLLNGALPFALLQLGFDPLHATVVAVGDRTIGFLGKSGYGKSTLGGTFLQAGYPVLTDDLLVLKNAPEGFLAYPGAPRIKLLPEPAAAMLGERMRGVRMNPQTRKLVIPLGRQQSLQTALPLGILYVIQFPRNGSNLDGPIRIRRLPPRRALMALIQNSYNDWLDEPARLHLQFVQYARIAFHVPVKRLSYPRRLDALPAVRDAILADLKG
ncbi:MAG: hypothetical protein HYX73_03185 [Acidobacteria bacterium]|nr:hypothetical protein [Acidobacteriota bacterium]